MGWASIHPDANLPTWLPPGTAVRIIRADVMNAMVENLDHPARGIVRRHKVHIPPLYFLEDERRWVHEGHPKVIAHLRLALDRERSLPLPHEAKMDNLRWILRRWRAIENPAAA